MTISLEDLRRFLDGLDHDPEASRFYSRFPRSRIWGATESYGVSRAILANAVDLRDLIHRMQETLFFSVNSADESVKHLAIEWLVGMYEQVGIDVESMSDEVEESLHSHPSLAIRWSKRRLSVDFLRTLSITHDIRHHLQRGEKPLDVMELGAGLGHLARTMRLMGVSRSHLIFDLPESLVYSCAFLSLNFPDAAVCLVSGIDQACELVPDQFDFVFVPSCYSEQITPTAELFVNTASLGEMRNETIRYWIDYVESAPSIRSLFTQNRFLNPIDPALHSWRWEENEASVGYGAEWTIRKWELEPIWYRCPYVAPVSARVVDIAAEKTATPPDGRRIADQLVAEVLQQDWVRLADQPHYMSMLQNPFVVDGGMTGTLFKLWESIRLSPSVMALLLMRRYLSLHLYDQDTEFEETRYYDQLLIDLVRARGDDTAEDMKAAAEEICRMEKRTKITQVSLTGETSAYNLVSADKVGAETVRLHLAVAKSLGPIELFSERIGDRELPPYILAGTTAEEARLAAEQCEREISGIATGGSRIWAFLRGLLRR